jgi:hypothetical protein
MFELIGIVTLYNFIGNFINVYHIRIKTVKQIYVKVANKGGQQSDYQ